MNSKNKGDISESAVILKLLELGIPVSISFGDRGVYLRVEPPKNNQVKDIHWAKDYKLGK